MRSTEQRIAELECEIHVRREELARLRSELPEERLEDFVLATTEGPVKLSDLFGGRQDLLLIHNMGLSCPYCTMWADGFSGLLPYLGGCLLRKVAAILL